MDEGLTQAELPQVTYTAGMKEADASAFAQTGGVLRQINGNGSFVLTNKKYPEFSFIASSHTHTGGTAACSSYAVCEVCGLEYGDLDPDNHEDIIIKDASDPHWSYDGYT